jgi:hypothetical protein
VLEPEPVPERVVEPAVETAVELVAAPAAEHERWPEISQPAVQPVTEKKQKLEFNKKIYIYKMIE